MSFLTVDFETYWADDYTLTKTTTEEYINDPRFEVIGVSVKVDGGKSVWCSGSHEEIAVFLSQFDWENSAMLSHNVLFDGAILAWKFGIVPAYYFDTLCMARALHGVNVRGSLKFLAELYNIGVKGTGAIDSKGKRRCDFTPQELREYGDYCDNDVQLTYDLFTILGNRFPDEEFDLIDLTLRMFTQPVLHIEETMLIDRLDEIHRTKNELLGGLKSVLNVDTEEAVRKKLCSNPQFAELLQGMGINPPTKLNKKGKTAWAFAKTDEGFLDLQEHPDPIVQILCHVRLGTKSTIEESRITRFIQIGGRNKGLIPIPLKYYAAHTGRLGGMDAINLQNLPTRDKKKKTLKNSLHAPPGHTIINCDSSQIEARILAWLAGQWDIVQAFAEKRDVYCEDASRAFGRTITKADEMERFVGKTIRLGLGFGTGGRKLQHTLLTATPSIDLPLNDCQRFVNVFRQANDKIVDLWDAGDRLLCDLASWPEGKMPYVFGEHGVLRVLPDGIHLPNGLTIRYPNLRLESKSSIDSNHINWGWVYDSRKGPAGIWGGTVVENVVQALARIVVTQQMIDMRKAGYRSVLTVHDAAIVVVPDSQLQQALADITSIMSSPRVWTPDLPVACEATYGKSYGECLTEEKWALKHAA